MTSTGANNYGCSIPAHPPGKVKFYLSANDSSNNTARLPAITPKLNPFVINFTDDSPPCLELSVPDSISVNRTADIFLNVTDDSDIESVELHFRGVADILYQPIEVTKIGAETYKGTILAQMMSGTVRVMAIVSDGRNTNQTQPVNVTVLNSLPRIEHEPLGPVPFGTGVTITAQIFDDLHVVNATLDWRHSGGSMTTLAMQRMGNLYRASLSFSAPTVVEYRIVANDAEGSSAWPLSGFHEFRVLDMTHPVIIHQHLTNLTTDQFPMIRATVTDDHEVRWVRVHCRNSTAEGFLNVSMVQVSGTNDYAALLERQPEGNFSYFIEAGDSTHTSRSPLYIVPVESTARNDPVPAIMLAILLLLLAVAAILVLRYLRRKPINHEAVSGDERVEEHEDT